MKLIFFGFILSIVFTFLYLFFLLLTENSNIYYKIVNQLFETNDKNVTKEVIIELKFGKIRGLYRNESGLEFYQFLGIPYAKAPIDEVIVWSDY